MLITKKTLLLAVLSASAFPLLGGSLHAFRYGYCCECFSLPYLRTMDPITFRFYQTPETFDRSMLLGLSFIEPREDYMRQRKMRKQDRALDAVHERNQEKALRDTSYSVESPDPVLIIEPTPLMIEVVAPLATSTPGAKPQLREDTEAKQDPVIITETVVEAEMGLPARSADVIYAELERLNEDGTTDSFNFPFMMPFDAAGNPPPRS